MSTDRQDDFDRSMRALHREAVTQLSPAVRHRLRTARTQAHAGAPMTRFGWPAASAVAAALVLAVALPLRTPAPVAPPSPGRDDRAPAARAPAAAIARSQAEPADPALPTALAALEESPDFYLWLASNDAAADGVLP